MHLTNQFPTLGRNGGPGNLQVRLGEGRLNEIENRWIVVDGDKLNGRWGTYGLKMSASGSDGVSHCLGKDSSTPGRSGCWKAPRRSSGCSVSPSLRIYRVLNNVLEVHEHFPAIGMGQSDHVKSFLPPPFA
jgi:hypothetical protein